MRFPILPLTLVFAHAAIAAPTGLLNDTGQTCCHDAGNGTVADDSAGAR